MRCARMILLAVVLLAVGRVSAEVMQPPAPTGPYAVGTTARHLVDAKRLEAFTEAADDHRELMVQFWYPAKDTEGKETVPYLPANAEVRKALFAQLMMSPAKVDEVLLPMHSHSVADAALSDAAAKYPVVLFSHGFGGYHGQNFSQMEELASRGYIVVAIDHTFCASAVEFPGGRIVQFAQEFRKPDPKADRAMQDKRFDELARLWGEDASFVIDELERINKTSGDVFAGHLDLDRIGMFGHSFGGATSGQMCLKDARVKCGINMDGRPYGDSRVEGVKRPFMVLCMLRGDASPAMLAMANLTQEQYKAIVESMMSEFDMILHAAPEGYLATFTHVEHYNFTDFPYFSELSPVRKNVVGDIDPVRGGKMVTDYVVAFFGKYLQNQPAPSLSTDAPHEPEVTLKVFKK